MDHVNYKTEHKNGGSENQTRIIVKVLIKKDPQIQVVFTYLAKLKLMWLLKNIPRILFIQHKKESTNNNCQDAKNQGTATSNNLP